MRLVRQLLRSRLAWNATARSGLNAANRLLPLLILPFLARVLGPESWGVVAIAQSIALYGIVLIQYGFELSGTRAVSRHRDGAPGEQAELVSGVWTTQLLLAALVVLVGLIVGQIAAPSSPQTLLWATIAYSIMQGLIPTWYFLGREQMHAVALLGIAGKALATVAILLLVRDQSDTWIVLACYAAGALIPTIASYWLMMREVPGFRFAPGLFGRTLGMGVQLFVLRVSELMRGGGDAFLLGLFVAPAQVALYVAGEKLCRGLAWLVVPISQALLPRHSYLITTNRDKAQGLAGVALIFFAAIGLGLAVVLALLGPFLVELVFGPGYEGAASVVRVMAFLIPLILVNWALINQWLVPHGLDRPLLLITLSAVALEIVMVIKAVPAFGIIGMALTMVIADAYITLGLIFAVRRNGLRLFDFPLMAAYVRSTLRGQ
jgi:PST family polysaccharide transporter